jgi:excisionase family DNA binding protein
MPKLWTADEVAQYWGVSYCTILRLIRAGDITVIRVGRSYRITEDVVRNGISTAQ